MGGLLSRLRADKEDNYEEVLSAIDDKIRRAEITLSEINVREKKAVAVWLVYAIFFYLVYALAYVLYLRLHLREGSFLLALVTLVTVPFGIYLVQNFIHAYYGRRRSNEEARLENLLALQKDKVEELKKKSAYYVTKSLIDRYESPQHRRANAQQSPAGGVTPTRPPGARPPGSQPSGTPSPKPETPPAPSNSLPAATATSPSAAKGATGASPVITTVKQRRPPQNQAGGDLTLLQTPPSGKEPRQTTPMSMPTPYAHQTPQRRAWYDKLVDVVIGDEGPETKYALICGKCFAHNGLVPAEEFEDIQYHCPHCNYFNPSRRKRREIASGKDQLDLDVSKTRRVSKVATG